MSNNARKTKIFKLMIGVFIALLIVGYGWTKNEKPAETAGTVNVQPSDISDEEQLKDLIVRLYKWKDKHLPSGDFVPLSNTDSSKYVGIDLDKHTAKLDVLRRSGFFTDEFLSNYNHIAKTINEQLKNETLVWKVGDFPPFGTGADFWCTCQDYPSNNPWDNIEVTVDEIGNDNALLRWTWGESTWANDFSYKVTATKINGSWRISYLQGFDPTALFQINEQR